MNAVVEALKDQVATLKARVAELETSKKSNLNEAQIREAVRIGSVTKCATVVAAHLADSPAEGAHGLLLAAAAAYNNTESPTRDGFLWLARAIVDECPIGTKPEH